MSSTRSTLLAAAVATLIAGCDGAGDRQLAGEATAETGEAVGTLAAAASPTDSPAGPTAAPSEAASIDYGFTRGDPEAPVAVVEFSDFGCPFCARFARSTFPTVEQEYIDAGTVRWRYVPVAFGFPGGELMGAAAICAAELGGDDTFWRVHDLFYTRQQALRGDDARPRLLEWVAELGVNRRKLNACIDAPETSELLQKHTEEAAMVWRARGTPTFVVNGVPMSGAAPIQFFRRVFDTALDPSGL